ncbi:hypothetical protein ASD74_24030 [Rhizobium sp. Root564]|nr:hypothetical protein ASE62_05230 [Rhizobium sp. Leaf202]KQN86287.1 hypothetical protein ASF03_22020 [Rhizobium sp. Leaf68]KQZ98429.1 hypothetical protein ASD74_24030 [Rhizobium sp. Root564]
MLKVYGRAAILLGGTSLLFYSAETREVLAVLIGGYLLTFAVDRYLEVMGAPRAPTGYRIFRKVFDYVWSGFESQHIDGSK